MAVTNSRDPPIVFPSLMLIARRSFLAGILVTGSMSPFSIGASRRRKISNAPLVIATWAFAEPGTLRAMQTLAEGGSVLDAVEQGIRVVEVGKNDRSVGLNGIPNAAGIAQLDACIMNGPDHKAGSVAALESVKHPISVARRVMEKTPHVMLVGEGARMFALQQGFETVPTDAPEKHALWHKEQLAKGERNLPKNPEAPNRDTITLLVLNANGDIAGGCSTSGLSGKLPGRVGDSPIIGSGLYVDNDVGAAGATGRGENIMRHCGSFMVVENMRRGMHPQAACEDVVKRIARKRGGLDNLGIHFLAFDKKGRHGAAGSAPKFTYWATRPGASQQLPGRNLSKSADVPSSGNRR
jgi:N4-(beta-N-acetylglucosaminyl)-L-asparaginase